MTDGPTTPSEANPAPARPRGRVNWHRVRVYLLSLLLMAAMWVGAGVITIRFHPDRLFTPILAQLPFPSSTGKMYWLNRRTLKIDDVKMGGFFYADSIILTASPFGLWRRHVAKVEIVGGQLFTKALYAAMTQMANGRPMTGINWTIGRLEISRGTLLMDNLIANTSIPVSLGARHPIVLHAIRLGKPDDSQEMREARTVEIGNVNLVSPFDPIAGPVLSFPLTRVRFSYEEIWHHHIRGIELIRPTMYLGQDLFWFSNEFKKQRTPLPAQGPTAPWRVSHFAVEYGRLAVNAFGQPIVHFPFFFNTSANDIRLDQLDQLSAKSVIAIQELNQQYPDYKIGIVGLTGRLYFSWPPTNASANNVVNTIQIKELSWNNIPVKDVSTTVTFDPNGVYGKLTQGTCEGGQLNGNFEFYYSKGYTWNADLFADKINCRPIAEKLVGKYVDLTGTLNGRIAVQGKATEILKCNGLLTLPNPGVLEIKSMDDLMKRLPSDMIALKRDALKLAISSFQTYPYDTGQLKIDYQPAGGIGTLKLAGPRGLRLFQVNWHPWGATPIQPNLTAELK